MKIDEAIEILTNYEKDTECPSILELDESLRLGVEAMKVLIYMRNAEHPVPPALLSGETT